MIPIWHTFKEKRERSAIVRKDKDKKASVVKILPVKGKKRLITRKQRHHVMLNVMMLP